MNKLIEHKSWWKKNWKWFTPIIGLCLITAGLISTSEIGGTISNTFKAYADPALIENALILAQENVEVKELLVTLKPIDKLAIMEGRVIYSDNNKSIDISFRVKGSIEKGRMRIFADRNGDSWEYKEIVIGIKKLKKTITIVERKK